MKNIYFIYTFFIIPFISAAQEGYLTKSMAIPMPLEQQIRLMPAEEMLLENKEYADLLVKIAPQELVKSLREPGAKFDLFTKSSTKLLILPQGDREVDTAKALAQDMNAEFICIDRYFFVSDDEYFYSQVLKNIAAALKDDKKVILSINYVGDLGTKSSKRISRLMDLLNDNERIVILLTTYTMDKINPVVRSGIPRENVYECGKLSAKARVDVIKFLLKKEIAAKIVDDKVVQLISQNTEGFSYRNFVSLTRKIRRNVRRHSLARISDTEVLPIIKKFKEQNYEKNKEQSVRFKKVVEFIKSTRIVPQFILFAGSLGIIGGVYASVEGYKKWREKNDNKRKVNSVRKI